MRFGILGAAVAAVLAVSGSASGDALSDNLSTLVGDQATGYLGPLSKGLSASANAGIFRGGHVPTAGLTARLDLTGSYISFSDTDRTYTAPAFGGYPEAEVPTVIGDPDGATVSQGNGLEFAYPGGFNLQNLAFAAPQITVGSVLGTKAMIRYVTFTVGDDEELGEFTYWAFGAQHSISQYLPGLPVDIAVGGMFQQFDLGSKDLVKADLMAWNVTGSRLFGTGAVKLEPYAGLGMDSCKMEANYDSGDESVQVKLDRQNDFRGTLGANVKFPIVSLNVEGYVAAEMGVAGSLSFGI
ncbi:MAG: DUF6588 family protein [bacterium]